ncbi:hypothetical protein AB0912_24255 [Streptomyces sp. NPDC007084]|uniref:hypothetical protein n=1 Tax=Streptomyces sp. NPDC007084 TaxID=3154313 RepID=UPI003453A39E
MPDPSWTAQQQAQQAAGQAQRIHHNHVRVHAHAHDMNRHAHDMARLHAGQARAHRPAPHTGGGRSGGLGGFPLLLVVVAVVVCLVRDPGLRDDVTAFARDLLTRVQSG